MSNSPRQATVPSSPRAALHLPFLTQAQAPLTQRISAVNEFGETIEVSIPAERALTVYVDKRELVTLMTLGAHPEWLVLGYLRNQRLVASVDEIESITVDWEVGAAAVKTRHGIASIDEKTARRVVTTGCGQGSVFGGLMDEVDRIELPAHAALTQTQLYALVNTIRLTETTYKSAGSVHACAIFDVKAARDPEMLLFVEDVGRHNAIDTIAGWIWLGMTSTPEAASGSLLTESGQSGFPMNSPDTSLPTESSAGLVFYTTGRLTSEMVIKSAQMNVPIVISRSGITQMGHQIAQAVGVCAIGRATNKRFICYTGASRLVLQPELAGPKPASPPG